MLLSQRHPSVAWEPFPLEPTGQFVVWGWFRPVANPHGIILSLPSSLYGNVAIVSRLTVRQLVAVVGLDPAQIQGWSIGTMNFDSAGGASPLLDQVCPPPPPGTNLEISVWMAMQHPSAWTATPAVDPSIAMPTENSRAVLSRGEPGGDQQLLDAIESCWNGVVQLEVKVSSLRKELGAAIGRLNSLNRDLTSHERLACDSRDLQEWSDARRWLRESVITLTKSVKEIDVGTTSGAGKRNQFDDIYRNHVEPRVPFPGMMETIHEYEGYRKILQYVVATAQSSLNKAGRGAESKANTVLQRIATKVRARKK